MRYHTPYLIIYLASLSVCGPCLIGALYRAESRGAEVDMRVGVDSDLSRQASWILPTRAEMQQRMVEWITSREDTDPSKRAKAAEIWSGLGDEKDILDTAIDTFAVFDPRCEVICKMAMQPHASLPKEMEWLFEPPALESASPLFFQATTIRLWIGRHMVRHNRFDEALIFLEGLSVESALDPCALLFHQAACNFWLLEVDATIELLDKLLERSEEIPLRYEQTARLMHADIKSLEDDSLDHISRRMRDITRRLDLGHAGPKTRTVQDGVVESLDKLIKEIEDQQQQAQASSGAGGAGGSGNGTPMEDSRIAEGKGSGEVQSKDIGNGDGWGNLPPREREEALQQIGREFPSHYREAIEQYFKRLASGLSDQ